MFKSLTKRISVSSLLFTLIALPTIGTAGDVFPSENWDETPPHSVGVDSSYLNQVAQNIGGHGIVIKNGYQIFSWGNIKKKVDWGSAFKPVMTTLLFSAIDNGLVSSVDEPIFPYLNDLVSKKIRASDKRISFRHLANQTSGYGLKDSPGASYAYNDYAMSLYALTLFHGVYSTKKPFHRLYQETWLGELQFQDGRIFQGRRWGVGLRTSVRDAARIGLFWLNKGNWEGKQLISKSIFDQLMQVDVPKNLASSPQGYGPQVDDYLNVGSIGGGANMPLPGQGVYGFNWWFNQSCSDCDGLIWPSVPDDVVLAMGHVNKEIIAVFPSQNIVVAAVGDWGEFLGFSEDVGYSLEDNLRMIADSVQF